MFLILILLFKVRFLLLSLKQEATELMFFVYFLASGQAISKTVPHGCPEIWKASKKVSLVEIDFNTFHNNILFLYPLKTIDNQGYSDVFRVYTNRILAQNGL